ncbi:hypothetical protein RUND412_000190 [Rhizina undulata]
MPEDATHILKEDFSGICQTFDTSVEDGPSRKQLDQPLCAPLEDEFRRSQRKRKMAFHQRAPIELLPVEIFDQIIPLLAIDTPSNGYTPRNKDLVSCLLVSRTFHRATLSTLYAHVTFPHSIIYSKFLAHIAKYPDLGDLVRRLDFSHFTSIGLGRTRRMNYEIQKLTATTLLKCLNLTPKLREFLSSESLDDDMDGRVLEKLFCGLPLLNAVDFCAAASAIFVNGFTSVISPNNPLLPESLPIKRLGLHGCTTLPPSVFATLLPRLTHLTHLDLTHTQITDGSLHAIPRTARLTHLSLSKCNRLKGPAVVDFLIHHPAAKGLVYLNLFYDTGRYRLLSTADLDELLPRLPKTLRSLNISGAKINPSHIRDLRRLSKHLEELSIGNADLSIEDLNMLIKKNNENGPGHLNARSNLRYLDLTGIASINPSALIYTNNCNLLLPSSYPLQVLELSEKVIDGLKERETSSKKLGWVVKGQHRRGWYVRAEPGSMPGSDAIATDLRQDDGARPWKMGGKWWGGRKIGMGNLEISGIYGYYGFGK